MTMSNATWFADPARRTWRTAPVGEDAFAFHRSLPGYTMTPLVELQALAAELGVGRVVLKDESSRLGLPAFKILGVSWAVNCVLAAEAGLSPARSLDELRAIAGGLRPLTLTTATDGNHGRALAHVAAMLGLDSHVVVPAGLPRAVVDAIETEGAAVEELAGSYDDAVKAAASHRGLLVQDTAWEGYETVPRWIVEGYSTLSRESEIQLEASPDLVVVPTGVGSLLQSVIVHWRSGEVAPAVLSAEPVTAACVLASQLAGEPRTLETPGTVMAGLNCGTLSAIAWDAIANGLDASVAVSDNDARAAMADLAALGVSAGPCGAASLAGVRAALSLPDRRRALAVGTDSVVVLINTEGVASGSASAV